MQRKAWRSKANYYAIFYQPINLFLPYHTPDFPSVLNCYLIFFLSLLFYFYFSSVSTVLLLSTVPQVSLSSSTFTFSHLCRLFSVSVQELQRKGQTWMMLFDWFRSHHSSKGPSYHFFPHFPSVSVVFTLCL